MPIIDRFTAETSYGRSLCTKQMFLSLFCFVSLDQITNIKICQMVASEHPEVIYGRRRLIDMGVPESEEAYGDGSLGNDGGALDKENKSGYEEADARTGVTEAVKKIWKRRSRL